MAQTSRPRRFLVVANQTAATPPLRQAIVERIAAGPSTFHVVVPATGASELARLAALAADPVSGYPVSITDLGDDRVHAHERARSRLSVQLAELEALGVPHATGDVGDEDPVVAIGEALKSHPSDEIVLSTLPAGISRWLSLDLPHRVERRFGLPVVVIEAPRADD